jgi:hypothetical protein
MMRYWGFRRASIRHRPAKQNRLQHGDHGVHREHGEKARDLGKRRAWRTLGFRFAATQPTALSSPSPGVPHPRPAKRRKPSSLLAQPGIQNRKPPARSAARNLPSPLAGEGRGRGGRRPRKIGLTNEIPGQTRNDELLGFPPGDGSANARRNGSLL